MQDDRRSAQPLTQLLLFVPPAAVFLVFFFPLLQGKIIDHDMTTYFFSVFRESFFRELARGELPLWNPGVALGYYQAGNPLHGYFYPLNLIFFVLPFDLAFSWLILVHYLIAGAGMFLFVRALTASRPAALVAASAYTLGGVMLSLSRNIGFLFTMAWHPVILFSLDSYLRTRKTRYLLVLLGSLTSQILNGDLQGFALSVVLAVVQVGFRALEDHPSPREDRAGFGRMLAGSGLFLGGMLLAAFIISMVQILPLLDMVGQSYRARGIPIEEAQYFSFHPSRLLNLFHPFLWGNKVGGTFWGEAVSGGLTFSQFWYPSVYLGIVTVFLAGYSLLPGRNRSLGICYTLLSGFFFLLACGNHTAVWPWFFTHVPGFSVFRFPAKYFSVVHFCLPVLAGIGSARLAGGEVGAQRQKQILGFLAFLAVGVCGVLFLGYTGFRTEIAEHSGIDGARALAELRVGYATAGFFAAAALGVLFLLGSPRRREYPALLLVTLLAIELLAGVPRLKTVDRQKSRQTPEIYSRVLAREKPHSFRLWYDVDAIPHFPSKFYRDLLLPNSALRYEVDYLFGNEPSMPQRTYELYRYNNFGNLPGLVKFADTRYILTNLARAGRPVLAFFPALADLELVYSDREKNLALYKNPAALPRVFTVNRWVWALDEKQAFTGAFHPETDLRKAVFLERSGCLVNGRPVGIETCRQATRQPGSGALEFSEADITVFRPNRVEMEATVTQPGVLVWCDSYYPGWRAYVNGEEAEIYRANYAFKGIFLGPGRNRIEFVFAPSSYTWGKRVSLAVLLLGGVCLIAGRVRRRGGSGKGRTGK